MLIASQFYDVMEVLVTLCYETAKSKGFWAGDNDNVPTKIALMHSELSELLEAFRSGNPDCEKPVTVIEDTESRRVTAMEEECADLFIRLCDFCGRLGIDLGRVTLAKMNYNATRPYRHGDKKC